MKEEKINNCFTIDDIHKLRELQDLKYEGISDDIRINDYHQVAKNVLEEIRLIQMKKAA